MVKSHHIAKNVYSDQPKPEQCFADFGKVWPAVGGVGSASGKLCALHKDAAAGPVYIFDINKPGRFSNANTLCTHSKKVSCSEWSPFNDYMLATASEDCSAHLNLFSDDDFADDGKLAEAKTDALQKFEGHQKKLTHVRWNPCAENTLLTTSWDRTVKLWDTETAQSYCNFEIGHNPTSLCWNGNGSLCAVSDNQEAVVFDPRQEDPVFKIKLKSKKPSFTFFMDKLDQFGVSTLEGSPPKNCINLYDMSGTLVGQHKFPEGGKVEHVVYDQDLDIMWSYSQGSVGVTYFDVSAGKFNVLGRDTKSPQMVGGLVMPKRANDITKCEVLRFLKVSRNPNVVTPLSYVIPRKSQGFHADVYPETYAGKSTCSFAEWKQGKDCEPIMGSFDPDAENWVGNREGVVFQKKATYDELQEENDTLRARIAELEAQVA